MNTKCPQCNYIATDHETLDEQKNPRDGDISFCINCGEFNEFKDGKLVPLNITNLDKESRAEMKKVREAWIRTSALARL